jgi:gliding motility-associated-like protein
MKKVFFTLFAIIIFVLDIQASHLVGGTIIYECTGGNQYKFTVIRYRDCAPGSVPMTNRPLILNPKGAGSNITVNLTLITTSTIPPPQTNPCLVPPSSLCREEKIYQATNVTLPNSVGGYDVYLGDQSRPAGITNIIGSNGVGQTLYVQIPNPGTYACNSGPSFVNFPPIVVCVNDNVIFDHSATDPNGDSLSYYLCNSLNGSFPSPAPPFASVPYSGGYSGTYPIASSPAFAINPVTGMLTGTPNLSGTFTFKVCVDEWRNGVKIGSYSRETDVTVTNCSNATASIGTDYTSTNLGIAVIASCDDSTVTFNNISNSGSASIYFWDFGVAGINTDTSSLKNPTYTYPDTGTYTVMLIVNPGYGCADTAYSTVIVYPYITSDFNWSSPQCVGQPIQFLDSSSATFGNINYWNWSFGNGFTGSTQNPFNTYTMQSAYNVRLIVESIKGCRDTIIKSIIVYNTPTVSAGPMQTVCAGDSVTIQASQSGGSTVSWSPATGLSCTTCIKPKAAPTTTTLYTLSVTGPGGCIKTSTVIVVVTQPPTVSAGPDKYLCGTGSVQLQGSVTNVTSGYTTSWSPTTGINNPNILTPTASPSVTTTYILTITTTNGCVVTDTVTVFLNSISIDAGNNQTICPGDTVQLSGSSPTPGLTYSWSPSGSLSNSNIANPKAWPSATTVYTMTATDPVSGCGGTDTVVITVSPLPPVNAGNDTIICIGTSANLGASGAVSYAWDANPSLSCTNCANPVATPSVTTKYYVTGTNAIGCVNRDSVTVTIQQLPNASVNPSTISICNSTSTVLAASGGVQYFWTPSSSLSCSTCPNPTATPPNTTTYTVTVFDIYGCSSTATTTVTIVPPPTITTIPATQTQICFGDTAQISASAANAVSYSWKPAATLTNPNIANPKAFPPVNTMYTVTVTDNNGCTNTDSVLVIVNVLQPGSFSPDTAICIGDSYQLFANGFNTYLWAPASSLSCNTCASPVATPTVTTTYTVHVADNFGCQDSGFVKVTVNPLPNVTTSPDATICINDSVQISANGGVSYAWAPVSTVSNPNSQATFVKPNNTTTYTVTVTDANACKNIGNVTVTVKPLPVISAGSDVNICKYDSTTLNASGGVSYVWTPGLTLSCTNCQSPVAKPLVDIRYTVIGTDPFGCKNTDSVLVKVNSIQPGNISPDTAICIGDNYQLFANGFTTYLWKPANTLSCSTCPNPVATPTTTTIYSVYVTNSFGCQDSSFVTVTVNQLPNATATATPDSICIGKSSQLMATGGISFSWSPGTGLNDPNMQNPTASPVANTNYTVTVTDVNKCKNTATQFITVLPLPNVSAIPASQQICLKDSAFISASGGISYTWSPNADIQCNTCPGTFVWPKVDVTYTVVGIDQYGCVNKDSAFVKVNSIQPGNTSPDTAICIGDSYQLYANGFVKYNWWPSATLSCSNCSNPVATPTTTTTYSVAVEDANGCIDTGSVTVIVNPLPTVTVSPDVTICDGDSTQLTAAGGIQYVWSPATGLSNPNIPNPIAKPNTTTNYLVTVFDNNKCMNTGTVTVTVNPLPNTNAGPDVSICIGDTTVLNGTGAANYQWTPSTGLSNPNIANPQAYPASTITYTLIGTHANGCTKNDNVTITVNPLPVPVVTPDQSICIGDNIQLQASGGSSYQWTPGTGLSCTNCPDPIASPSTTTTYTVRVFNTFNCYKDDSVKITVASPAAITVIPTDTSICPGESVSVIASGGVTYVWSPNIEISNPNIPNPVITPTQSRIYTLDVTDVSGCNITETVNITLYVPANPSAGTDATICEGDTTNLTASNGVSYDWQPPSGLSDPAISNPLANPLVTTIYTVTIVDVNGCSNAGQVEIIVIPPPPVSAGQDQYILEGGRAKITATGASTYIWTPDKWLVDANAASTIVFPEDTITYTVLGTDQYGCMNIDSVTVFVLQKTKFWMPNAFTPNGDGKNDEFKIEYAYNFNLISFKIFNRWGKLVYESDDITRPWDGTDASGRLLPMDSYIYIMEAVDDIGNPIRRQGNITLIR